MRADLKQAILACLVEFCDQRCDGTPMPMWADTMAVAYCADDGITNWPDVWNHIYKEIAEQGR